VHTKICEELGGVEWTLLNKTKYPLNVDAACAALVDVDATLTQARLESSRQLVRFVMAWFFYIPL